MRVGERCARCLYDKQKRLTDNEDYLGEIRGIIDNRDAEDTAPYLVYQFSKVHERYFGAKPSYRDVKREYNDLVMGIEDELRERIERSSDPFVTSLLFSRVGNYIDFGAMNEVDKDTFAGMFAGAELSGNDIGTLRSFTEQLEKAGSFLLIADNCGEIVLDKLFIEQLHKRYPEIKVTVMVRGGEVLNDVTTDDVRYTGVDRIADIVDNGSSMAGTVYKLLSEKARNALDGSDVILAKGQGNYETLCEQGRHIFYSFLCKCDLFTERFNVPRLTGIFIEEGRQKNKTEE